MLGTSCSDLHIAMIRYGLSDFQSRWRRSRYTVPLCTTKRRTTTNLKTKNNQNCQKIELYGSPTTKELKKKHSSIPVGRTDMDSRGGVDAQQGSAWRTVTGGGWQSGWSHICVQINGEEHLGNDTDHTTQGSSAGK